ncbi:barren protein [Myxozyma melibiosi]|uniref:Condensin complex subunit 2 n=1 Tax=Myxozyma melibiosi TaxID=54550 RepID=A0ABR1F807_9ASCO
MARQQQVPVAGTPSSYRSSLGSRRKISGLASSPAKSRNSNLADPLTLNDDSHEKRMRNSSRRTAVDEANRSIIAAATPANRSLLESDSAENTPKVPLLSNFEEWMKLATDNKINASNSWNFALIDYFHDMSLLKEGDGINFQKASCTLDGCVKIYTSRIDSVATETGKLLSGLTDNASKQAAASSKEAASDDEDDEEQATSKKPKRRPHADNTLVKDFEAIQIKKLDLEVSIDPLFKKATADFDEGGAKGMLLNHLSIEGSGRVVFDTNTDIKHDSFELDAEEKDHGPSKELDLSALKERYSSNLLVDINETYISPSLKDFEFPDDSNTVPVDIPFLKDFEAAEDDVFPPAGSNDDYVAGGADFAEAEEYSNSNPAVKEEFGNGGDLWLENIRNGSQVPEFHDDDYSVNLDDWEDDADDARAPGAYVLQFAKEAQTNSASESNDIFAYFDESIKKNWAGTQNWKIKRVMKGASDSKKPAQTRQVKKKTELVIDFIAPSVDEESLFESGNPSSIQLSRSHWRSETRNLLPDDINFNSKKLLRLFLKPKVQLRFISSRDAKSRSNNGMLLRADTDVLAGNSEGTARGLYDDDGDYLRLGDGDDESDTLHGANYDADFFAEPLEDAGIDATEHPEPQFVDAVDDLYMLESQTTRTGADPENSTMVGQDISMYPAGNQTEIRDETEYEFGSQLVLSNNRSYKTDFVKYARVAKKVDVKRLKDSLWTKLNTEEFEAAAKSSDRTIDSEEKQFSELVEGLTDMYPSKALADISTSFCFICLLHLANERGLEIDNNADFSDLAIRKVPDVEIEQY